MGNIDYQSIYNNRKLWGGETDWLQSYKPSKYNWIITAINNHKKNLWFPESIRDIHNDKTSYNKLTPAQKRAFNLTLARVTNADWIQLTKLNTEIMPLITANEFRKLLGLQAYEEDNHTNSYAYIAENVLDDPMEIEMMYLNSTMLADTNTALRERSYKLDAANSAEDFALLLVTNIILEGLLFYTNFLWFYNLGVMTGDFNGTIANIRYINKDEDAHNKDIFVPAFKTHVAEYGLSLHALRDRVFALFADGVHHESTWGIYANNNGEGGLLSEPLIQFVEHRADECLKLIGYVDNPYSNVVNPYPFFYELNGSGLQRDDSTFQSTVTSYAHTEVKVGQLDLSGIKMKKRIVR